MVKFIDGVSVQICIPICFESYDFYVSLHITTQECIEQMVNMLDTTIQMMLSKESYMLLREEDGCFLPYDKTWEQLKIKQGEVLYLL